MNEERKVNVGKRGGTLRGSVALCEDFGRKGRKERKGAGKDGTMNHQTTKLPNYQTISGHLGRWAAVAAGAAGARLESARMAGAVAGMAKGEAIG